MTFDLIDQRVSRFVVEMNKWASHFRLQNTKFTNPHGLGNHLNLSTANDVGLMSCAIAKN